MLNARARITYTSPDETSHIVNMHASDLVFQSSRAEDHIEINHRSTVGNGSGVHDSGSEQDEKHTPV
jgi:hypothetical protein